MFNVIRQGDIHLLKIFNNTIRCKALDVIMPLITQAGSSKFTLFYCLFALFYPSNYIRQLGIKASTSLIMATLIVQILKRAIGRIRPYDSLDDLYISKIGIDKYSFPSGHSAAAVSLAATTCIIFPGLAFICIILATLVPISRMYLGVHFPSDVTVGALIGIVSSIITNTFLF